MYKRNHGIELLRIVSMFYIVMFHIPTWGMVHITADMPVTLNYVILAVSYLGGGLGNCAFVLISGYLLIDKEFSVKRIIRLWFQVLCWSIFCGIIAFAIGTHEVNVKSVLSMVFPLSFNEYWYISTYMVVMLISPYLNKFLLTLSRKEYKRLIVIGLILFSVMPTLLGESGKWLSGTNSIAIFLVLYILGGYISLFEVELMHRRRAKAIGVLMWFALVMTIFVMKYISKSWDLGLDIFYFVWPMDKLSVIIVAVWWFLIFKDSTIRLPRYLLTMAGSVFGVYLFHIGRLRYYLLQNFFDYTPYYGGKIFLVLFVIEVLSIFGVGIVLDLLRKKLLEERILILLLEKMLK